MHCFPYQDPEAYREWLRRIGREELCKMDPIKVNRNYRVCDDHFSSFSRLPEGDTSRSGLKKRALPTLYLPGFREAASEENSRLHYLHDSMGKEESSALTDVTVGSVKLSESIAIPDSEHSTQQVVRCEEDLLDTLRKSFCRVCGVNVENMYPIFESVHEGEDPLAVKMNMYLPYKVEETDAMPLVICSECVDTLNRWHKLNVTCISTNAVLKKMFSGMLESIL